jgi:hypothetical protein
MAKPCNMACLVHFVAFNRLQKRNSDIGKSIAKEVIVNLWEPYA